MKVNSNIKKIVHAYPMISRLGYPLVKRLWKARAIFLDYEYPENEVASIMKEEVLDYNKARIFGPQKRFCYAPFNNIHFKVNGDVTLCSFNDKLTIGNIRESRLYDIWKSQQAEHFRDRMRRYDLSNCLECKMAFSFKNYSSLPTTKYDFYADDAVEYPNQMSFETSNLCNLECIMCNEVLSSSIRKTKGMDPLPNVYDEAFLEDLKTFIPHLKIATFIGGEPLLIRQYYKVWEQILSVNSSCEIHIQTNATVLPERFNLLLDSGHFDVGVSLDAISRELFERIRGKSSHEKVFANVKTLIGFYRAGKINLNVNFCLMSVNWHELPLMLEFCNEHNISLKIIHINAPFHLDIKNLPSFKVKRVYDVLSTYLPPSGGTVIISRNKRMYDDALATIKSYIGYSDKMYEFLNSYNGRNLNELYAEIRQVLRQHIAFTGLSDKEKNDVVDFIVFYLDDRRVAASVKEDVCKRLLYHFLINEHNLTDRIDFGVFQKVLDGYLEIELQVE